MAEYTITLTDVEVRAMEHVCVDVNEWIQNAFSHRVAVSIQGLSDLEIKKAIEQNQDVITDRLRLVELSNEPPAAVRGDDPYAVNPDAPFNNPITSLP